MKTTLVISILSSAILFTASIGATLTVSSCTPDPTLQKQMDRDILAESEREGAGSSTGSQQGQGSKNYGYGGF